MAAFLGGILSKKYTNPSSDVIAVLAGLDKVDKLVSDLVSGIDDLIRNGNNSESILHHAEGRLTSLAQLRGRAIDVALALTAGAYQTGLISYLTHRDLFPSLMKVA